MKKLLIYSIFLFLALNNFAQVNRYFGNTYLQNYSYKEYKSAPQVWSIAQDKRGIMYFTTSSNLITYDGSKWKQYKVANNTVIRSIDIDSISGKVYVGANEEFGYFSPNNKGELEYTSISKKINKKDKGFQDIWKTHVTSHGIYFVSFTKIFRWHENKLTAINAALAPTLSFNINDKIYIVDAKKGLSELIDTSIVQLPNFEKLHRNFGYLAAGKLNNNELIIASNIKGIFIYDLNSKKLTKVETEYNIDKYLLKNISYSFTSIDNNNFAIGTLMGGILIVNRNGKLIKIINTERGLPANSIYSLFADKDKNLWIGLETGISHASISSKSTFFDKKNGLDSYTLNAISFKNKVYIATMGGTYYIDDYKLQITKDNHLIKQFRKKTLDTWSFLIFKNRLLAFGSEGIVEIQDTIMKQIYNSIGNFSGGISGKFPNKIFVGQKLGLIVVNADTTNEYLHISNQYKFPEIKEEIRDIVCDKDNNLWLGTDHSGIIYIRFTGDSVSQHIVTKFQEKHFPDLNMMHPKLINNEIIILSAKGIFKPVFQEETQSDSLIKFVHDEKWTEINKDSTSVTALEIFNNNTYFISGEKNGILSFNKNKTLWNESPFVRIPTIEKFISQNDGNVFITCDGFYIYNSNLKKDYKSKYSTLIRKVSIKDSIIFFGNYIETQKDSTTIVKQKQTKQFIPKINYKLNSLIFEYSANFYEKNKETTYSCILEGFDEQWSDFSPETKSIYTNIPEGEYIFKVKAKNIYQNISQIAEYKFTIKAPWYRTYFAYAIYILLAILIIYIIVKLNTKRLIKEKEYLEEVVTERTAEINQQKEEIQTQADNLQTANDSIMKQQAEMLIINKELEKLSIVASKTDNAILIFDENLNLEWVNEAYTKIYDYKIEELLKEGDLNLTKISQNKKIKQIAEEAISKNKSVFYETENTTKKGIKKWVQTTLTPIFEENKLTKIIAIESDISEIQKAKAKISIQNQQITSSISYAQTIQKAILPIDAEMDKHFNYFLIFKPKDIVSGDFYWIKKLPNNEGILIAEIDCTGHGVPGAFMSLIGSTLLSEIVNIKKITEPASILSELNILVRNTLKQEKTENRDGMDLSICKFQDNENGTTKITFAGAKQDLLYYQKSEKQIKKVKGTRKSIGGAYKLRRELEFTNNEITLSKGDIVYILSDGYIDQNNSERKRIGSAKLNELLNNIAEKDLHEQKVILEETLSNWQGNESQRDDITMFGIRI